MWCVVSVVRSWVGSMWRPSILDRGIKKACLWSRGSSWPRNFSQGKWWSFVISFSLSRIMFISTPLLYECEYSGCYLLICLFQNSWRGKIRVEWEQTPLSLYLLVQSKPENLKVLPSTVMVIKINNFLFNKTDKINSNACYWHLPMISLNLF